MTDEKIERIKKMDGLLQIWEQRWKTAQKTGNVAAANRILKKEIDPLRKRIRKEVGEHPTMRDQLKIAGMSDYEVSAISQEFLKMLLMTDYIANVSSGIKSKLRKCGIDNTTVGEAIDNVAKAAQEVGDNAVGHKRLRDTAIAMLVCHNDDLLDELDKRLDDYINNSIDMYNQILREESAEGEEH